MSELTPDDFERLLRLYLDARIVDNNARAADTLVRLVEHLHKKVSRSTAGQSYDRCPGLGGLTQGDITQFVCANDDKLPKQALASGHPPEGYMILTVKHALIRQMTKHSPPLQFVENFMRVLRALRADGEIEVDGSKRLRISDAKGESCVTSPAECSINSILAPAGPPQVPVPHELKTHILTILRYKSCWIDLVALRDGLAAWFRVSEIVFPKLPPPIVPPLPVGDYEKAALALDKALKAWSEKIAAHGGRLGRITNYQLFTEYWLWSKDEGALTAKEYAGGLPPSEITRRSKKVLQFLRKYRTKHKLDAVEMADVLRGLRDLHAGHNPNREQKGDFITS